VKHPAEYARRVLAFFDTALPSQTTTTQP
jgi:hypothetical protein